MKTKSIIIRPLYTEKMAAQQESMNKYAFSVNPRANKIEIKSAIENKFDVKVKSVKTMNVRGKMRQQMTRQGRFIGRKSDWKKAIVTLEADYKLDLFDNA
ncbi:MAG TPA: 50S ribosomal protein L23 [Caldithrix abyssi]|uniref:Large ribosomal subunit protein uL23 n=1 Tax=Caldithrix abyssi TaxID=187145 RepID=A0A7V4U3I9_CALAY|nr:50S ribosomal protein L23 [Caldithrix abyssi]